MAKKENFNNLVKEFGDLQDPLLRAKEEMIKLLENDIQVAKQRYIDVIKKNTDKGTQTNRKNNLSA